MLKATLGLIAAIAIVMFGLWAIFAFVTLELSPFEWCEPNRVLFVTLFGVLVFLCLLHYIVE